MTTRKEPAMHATSIFSDEILKQADELRKAEGQYEKAFDHWAQTAPTLSPDHFWKNVQSLRLIWSRSLDAERAANEYLRVASVEGEEQLAAAIHFCVSYRRYAEGMSGACEHLTEGWERGDDGFGDLMDSLPMAGEQVYVEIKSGDFFGEDEDGNETVNISDLEKRVKEIVPHVADRIIHGENYWASTLEQAAAERMKSILCLRG